MVKVKEKEPVMWNNYTASAGDSSNNGRTGDEGTPKQIERVTKNQEITNWIIFTKSFINIIKSELTWICKKERLQQNDKIKFIAIVYNLRHSIEIIIKLLLTIDWNNKNGHNLQTIYQEIKMRNIDDDHNKILKNLVEKYSDTSKIYNHKTIIEAIDYMKDPQNEFFKYPSHNKTEVTIVYKYDKLTQKTSKRSFNELKKDIDSIEQLLSYIEKNILSS